MVGGGGVFHGAVGHDNFSATAVPAIAHALKVPPLSMKAVLAKLHAEPRCIYPHQRFDGQSVPASWRVFASAIGIFHARLVPLRRIG